MQSSKASTTETKSKCTVSRTKVCTVHTLIAFVTTLTCIAFVHEFDGLLSIGKLRQSPVIWILLAGELIKFGVNKGYLRIEAQHKDITLPGTNANHNSTSTMRPKLRNVIMDYVHDLGLVMLCIAFAAAASILFGAPVFNQHEETVALAILLSTLTLLPFVLYLRASGTLQYLFCDQFELTSKNQTAYLNLIHYNAVFALIGAWSASVVAPLDWDCAWQAYPVPNMCGAVVGYAVGNIFTLMTAGVKKFKRPKKTSSVGSANNKTE